VDGLRSQVEYRHELSNRLADDAEYFPPGYHAYFQEICHSRWSGFDAMAAVPLCAIRVVTGHGYARSRAGVMRTRTNDGERHQIPFTDLPGPTPAVLSIFDICGSQWAAAAAFGYFDDNPNKKLRKRGEGVSASRAPFACENADATWTFRVGAPGDHLDPPNDEDALSRSFGDTVVCSVLAAAKDFFDNGLTGTNLDSLFLETFAGLNAHYLDRGAPENHLPNPKANLDRLQALMQQGLLALNHATFDCSLFARHNQWFLTRSRTSPPAFAEVSEELSAILLDYVVVSMRAWHYSHRNDQHRFELCAEKFWSRLSGLLGPGIYTTPFALIGMMKEIPLCTPTTRC
jgi:hypothetical protein